MIELTTQCPQCHYQFTVTLQQLQQRKGVSRCPQCAHIFDAYDQAVQGDKQDSQVAISVAPLAASMPEDLPPVSEPLQESVTSPKEDHAQPSTPRIVTDHKSEPSPEDSELRWHFIGKEPLSVGVPNAPTPGAQFSISGLSADANQAGVDDVRVYLDRERVHVTEPFTDRVHLAEPRSSSRFATLGVKEKKASHPLWGMLLFILLCCVVVQLVYVYRVQLANSVKLTRPLLEMMCEVAECDVPYMREINAIDITHSALKQQAPSSQTPSGYTYTLQLQMQNTLAWDQEWPTLVLSFSDAAAAVMATIAVPPEQYLPRSQRSRPFDAGAQITIRLPVTVANKKINGFTVDKYYP